MKPNILLIFADQMHRYAMGCAGNPDIRTPHLDQFARQGMLFTRGYSNCPVCTPFRINLMTGMYSSNTNSMTNAARIPTGRTTLAARFGDAGYATSYVGKWHIGDTGQAPIARDLQGDFQRFNGYQCYNGFKDNVRFYDQDGAETVFDLHRTDATTQTALDELSVLTAIERPFLLSVSYQAPHYPVQPSPEYEALYTGKPIHHRDNFGAVEPYTQTFSPPSPKPKENDPDFRRYGGDMDEYIRLYYGMVSQIDAGVGKILGELAEKGQADNTVVIFTSDHGDMQGSHGLVNKCYPYEESAGIPFIISGPGVHAGTESDSPVSGVDIMPTVLEMAELQEESGIDGRSFCGCLSGGRGNRVAYSEFGDWRMVVSNAHKLVVDAGSGTPRELFDLDHDPYELNNIVDEHTASETRQQLMALCESEYSRNKRKNRKETDYGS